MHVNSTLQRPCESLQDGDERLQQGLVCYLRPKATRAPSAPAQLKTGRGSWRGSSEVKALSAQERTAAEGGDKGGGPRVVGEHAAREAKCLEMQRQGGKTQQRRMWGFAVLDSKKALGHGNNVSTSSGPQVGRLQSRSSRPGNCRSGNL